MFRGDVIAPLWRDPMLRGDVIAPLPALLQTASTPRGL